MKIDWRQIGRIAAGVADKFIPGVLMIEQLTEQAADGKSNEAKAAASVEAALAALDAEGRITGKNYVTPRVRQAAHAMNDATVEFLNAVAEAHAATKSA